MLPGDQTSMKKFTLISIACLLVFVIVFAYFVFQKKYGWPADGFPRVCFKNKCFDVEIAATEAERQKGLMNRESLGADKGMIFIFDKPANYSFWMKNTLIPLDMVWLDQDRKIVFINENAQPCGSKDCSVVTPVIKSQYVFEAKAGTAKRIGLKYGDQADFFLYAKQ